MVQRGMEHVRFFLQFEKKEGEDSVERFERIGRAFYKATGYVRPGKDCVLHEPMVRQAAWDKWIEEHVRGALNFLEVQ